MKTTSFITTIALLLAMLIGKQSFAQFSNLQVHRELGSINVNETTKVKRDGVKAKFEMLGFDSLGIYYWNTSTLYSTNDKSVSAQLQVLRGFLISRQSKFQLLLGHQSATGATSQYYAGIHHPLKLGRVKFLPFLAYVYSREQRGADFRFTTGVSTHFAQRKLVVFGFLNAYTRDKVMPEGTASKEIGFQANPQLWLNLNRKLAVGGEVGVDYLASRYQKVIAIPTVGGRWSF